MAQPKVDGLVSNGKCMRAHVEAGMGLSIYCACCLVVVTNGCTWRHQQSTQL